MAVTVTDSTNAGYKVISSVHATLTTAISDVINELEQHKVPAVMTDFVLTFDDTGQEYIFMAVCKRASTVNT